MIPWWFWILAGFALGAGAWYLSRDRRTPEQRQADLEAQIDEDEKWYR